jgi:predicted acetyltransferase
MSYQMRPIEDAEVDAFLNAVVEAFHRDPDEDDMALWRLFCEPDRTLAVYDGGEIVATSGLLSFETAVPGGARPTAGVTAVGVHAVHRGRGLFDRMMVGHLEAIQERGQEAIATLYASEGALYGRYGYGLGSRVADLQVRSPEARLRVPPAGPPRHGAPEDLVADMRTVYESAWRERPGMMSRDDRSWQERISDLPADRHGAGRLRAAVADGEDGPEGFVTFAIRKHEPDGRPADVVVLRELVAATPEAAATLWHFLIGLSLTRSVTWDMAPEDEPLVHHLVDPRAVDLKVADGLFVRLVDVPRALSERTYSSPVDVVLEVADERCPWNARRVRLAGDATGATCEPTTAPADLALSASELGAAYLGGTTLDALAAAGRVRELAPGALAVAARAFRGTRAPWCPEMF